MPLDDEAGIEMGVAKYKEKIKLFEKKEIKVSILNISITF